MARIFPFYYFILLLAACGAAMPLAAETVVSYGENVHVAAKSSLDWLAVATGIFIGFTLLPVAYNLSSYRVLHEDFLLWHSARAVGIIILVLGHTPLNLGPWFASDTLLFSIVLNIGFDGAIAASGPFLRRYLEPHTIGSRTYRLLGWCFPATFLTTPAMFLPIPGYFLVRTLVLVSILGLLIYAIGAALCRRSRAARYQALAWSGIVAVCSISLFHDLVLGYPFTAFIPTLFAALAFEIVVGAIGVADRFMTLKHDRDSSRAEASAMRKAAFTDPLTSLPNRRGLEAEFDAGKKAIRALAIIDLDHFKRINDTYGHDVGDDVLVAAAQALANSKGYPARLGGEEFALLLNTEDWREDAEAARASITAQVARIVPGLGFPATASMGLVAMNGEDSFSSLLKQADICLYEAKAAGRDQTVLDRVVEKLAA